MTTSAAKKPLITANMVTFVRLLSMPLVTWFVYNGHFWKALISGTLIGCTDFVDGYLARKHGPTVLGGLIDPIADKVFIAFVYLPFVQLGLFPAWAVALMFVRELMVTALRTSYSLRDLQMKTSYLGKVKTWIQMQGIGMVMLLVLMVPHPDALTGVLVGSMLAPLVAMAAFYLLKKKLWLGAILMSAGQAPLVALHLHGDLELTIAIMMYAIVFVTWLSGFDYLAIGLKKLRGRGDLGWNDMVRLLGGLTLPCLLIATMVEVDAWSWPLISILALELAVGGLDNLYAHHRRSAGAAAWAARTLGASVLLVAALVLGYQGVDAIVVDVLVTAAAAVTLVGVTIEFWRGRDVYLDEKKRDEGLTA